MGWFAERGGFGREVFEVATQPGVRTPRKIAGEMYERRLEEHGAKARVPSPARVEAVLYGWMRRSGVDVDYHSRQSFGLLI